MIFAALLAATAATAAPAPSAEALELARHVAANGMLVTVAPLQMQGEVEGMIAEHTDLTEAQRTRLRQIGEDRAGDLVRKAIEAEAAALAANLSLEDLRALARFAASDAARNQREAMPQVLLATLQALGNVDYAGAVEADFCAETGLLCPAD